MSQERALTPTRLAAVIIAATHVALVLAVNLLHDVGPRTRGALSHAWASPVGYARLGDLVAPYGTWASGLLAVGLLLLAARPALWPRLRTVAYVLLLVGVLVGASLHVMARRLDRRDYHDAGDNYHYVLGAKYFAALGYTRHYECSALALEELGRNVPRRMRDLRTNERVRTEHALSPQVRADCHDRFGAARWEAFKRDLRRFRNWHSFPSFAHRLTDHGYNGTPFWTQVSRALIALFDPIDARHQDALASLNIALLGVGAVAVVLAFGWELGLTFLLLLWVCYPDRFVQGGAHMRYLSLSLLMVGSALLKARRGLAAGAVFGAEAALLIFPGLLLVPAGLAVGVPLLRRRRPPRQSLRFAVGAAAALALAFIISVSHADGIDNWRDFLHQMHINSGRLANGRIGFVYNFIWPKELSGEQLSYEPRVAALQVPLLGGLALDHLRQLLAAVLAALALRYGSRRNLLTAALWGGFALFFLGFSTVRYYYAGLVCLPLMWHGGRGPGDASPAGRFAKAALGWLALLQLGCYLAEPHVAYALLFNTILSGGLTLYLLATIVLFAWLPAARRRRAPADDRSHGTHAASAGTPASG